MPGQFPLRIFPRAATRPNGEQQNIDAPFSQSFPSQPSLESPSSFKAAGSLSDIGDLSPLAHNSSEANIHRMPSVAFGESAAGRPHFDATLQQPSHVSVHLCHPTPMDISSEMSPSATTQASGDPFLTDQHSHSSVVRGPLGSELPTLLPLPNNSYSISGRVPLMFCFGWILLVFQMFDAGGGHVIIQHQDPMSKLALLGRAAFEVGQAIGPIIGAPLHALGPWALVGDLILASITAVVAGLSKSYMMLDILRGLAGVTSGVFLTLVLNDVLAIMAVWRLGSLSLVPVLIFAILSQIAGSWLSTIVVLSDEWHWLYYSCGLGLVPPVILLILERRCCSPRLQSLPHTKSPRTIGARLKCWTQAIWLPFVHAHLSLAALSTACAAGFYVSILSTINIHWMMTFQFTPRRALLTNTFCVLVSCCLACLVSMLYAHWKPHTASECCGQKQCKGFRCPQSNPERRLVQSCHSLIVVTLCLLLMSFVARRSSAWILIATVVIVLGTAALVSVLGSLQYVLEAYRPICDGSGNWGRHYVVASQSACLNMALGVCAQLGLMSLAAYMKLGFGMLCGMLGIGSLVATLFIFTVYIFGAKWRRKCWDKALASGTVRSQTGRYHPGQQQHDVQHQLPQVRTHVAKSPFETPTRGQGHHQDIDMEELDISAQNSVPRAHRRRQASGQHTLIASSTAELCANYDEEMAARAAEVIDGSRRAAF